MAPRTIAVIDDEEVIATAVAARLRSEGFQVAVAGDGPSGVRLCERIQPDLVVLDLMLPGFDGFEVCRRIQAERPTPVLMLTARDTETDKLVGLGLGADDYMTKPFSVRELVARVQAILRRVDREETISPNGQLTVERSDGPTIVIDLARRRVAVADDIVHLTPTEFDLLRSLAARPGVVFSREQLLAQVWGFQDGHGARAVDSQIQALRRKLGATLIRTVHGIGYAIEDSQ
jgi:DNA-binding response OmpR family regulator